MVETLAVAGGALAGEEPAVAFLAVPGVQVWHWPPERRPEQSSKMHAKLAIADSEVLLVSSANLTQSGIGKTSKSACSCAADPQSPGPPSMSGNYRPRGHSNACTRVAPLFEPNLARARRGTR